MKNQYDPARVGGDLPLLARSAELSAGGGAYGVRPIASLRLIRFSKQRRKCCTKSAKTDVQYYYRHRWKRSVAIEIGTANNIYLYIDIGRYV